MVNLVLRFYSLGLLAGLFSTITLGVVVFSPAEAAHPAWSGHATPAKRPLFRPWSRYPRRSAALRWRPQPQPSPAARATRATIVRSVPGLSSGSGDAYATAPRAMAWQFRPERRGAGQNPAQLRGWADRQAARAHAGFRPPRVKRQQSYEEMQAQGGFASVAGVPGGAYGLYAAAPAYTTAWPRW